MAKQSPNTENEVKTDKAAEVTTETTVPAGENNLPVEVDEESVTDEIIQDDAPNSENVTYDFQLMPGVVTVDEAQLNELMDQNVTMKAEIGLLVGLFQNFEGLISGKAGFMGLVNVIPKLMANPKITAQIDAVAPIIQKYTSVKS